MARIQETGDKASVALRRFEPMPQKLVSVAKPRNVLANPPVKSAIAQAEAALGRAGRVLIRPSGTEAVIRVMAEGEDAGLVNRVVADIVAVIQAQA